MLKFNLFLFFMSVILLLFYLIFVSLLYKFFPYILICLLYYYIINIVFILSFFIILSIKKSNNFTFLYIQCTVYIFSLIDQRDLIIVIIYYIKRLDIYF